MEKEKPNRKNKSSQEGYVNLPNNFLTDWAKVLSNREYCSLRFSEVQKELTGMKIELGKIE